MNCDLMSCVQPKFQSAVVDQQFGQLSVTVQNLQSFFWRTPGAKWATEGFWKKKKHNFHLLGRPFVRIVLHKDDNTPCRKVKEIQKFLDFEDVNPACSPDRYEPVRYFVGEPFHVIDQQGSPANKSDEREWDAIPVETIHSIIDGMS
ncbi:hypothetical protein CAPTEDRAFT_217573 [Capitella teleta]|uniref:Uncharacterized protein n=1 Tax=Capitella teleta TaxID=283909 RepID=R7THX6_CAPTE|nr:hypothetical protein CAPTEDRAFT_217573 [Capitella teleta]|eukprot:ELT91161.1 hypothetical protein CAPTEDRAFT_217573 [Capitella teleta]